MTSNGPMPFVILASGVGTNAKALLDYARKNPRRLVAKAVISDRPGVPALQMAEKMKVPTYVVSPKEEGPMLAILSKLEPHWALLAGYKRLVGPGFLNFFADAGFHRVMNVHPSLLPAYPGLNGYERAFQDGVKVTGVTVHLVDSGLDTGLCLLQESFERAEKDDLESFTAKGRKIEHRLFTKALGLAAAGRIRKNPNSRWVSLSAPGRKK